MADGAIMHMSVSTISRAAGRSAVAAAAYRAGTRLRDTRTGIEHDYGRKRGIVETFIAAPDGCAWITDRQTLWDAAEAAESRKNSVVAREWLVALPDALDAPQRAELARALAVELVTRFGVAVDVAIHAPSKQGDERNHHAHLLTTTRTAGPDGLGDKTRILDAAKTGGPEIEAMRAWWAGTVNDALAAAKSAARIDHRPKVVVAAEKQAEAEALEARAAEVEAATGNPAEVGGVWKGLGHAARAVRAGGLSALFSVEQTVRKLKDRAQNLRNEAERLAIPPARHHGPALTALWRRMGPIWEAQRAAEKARQEQREAEVARKVAEMAAEARRGSQDSLRAEQPPGGGETFAEALRARPVAPPPQPGFQRAERHEERLERQTIAAMEEHGRRLALAAFYEARDKRLSVAEASRSLRRQINAEFGRVWPERITAEFNRVMTPEVLFPDPKSDPPPKPALDPSSEQPKPQAQPRKPGPSGGFSR